MPTVALLLPLAAAHDQSSMILVGVLRFTQIRNCFRIVSGLIALCLLLPAVPLRAAEQVPLEVPATSWMCWVVLAETHYLRCVLDSEAPHWRELDLDIDEQEFMQLFRARFDDGAGREELERLFQAFSDKLQFINFWYIPVYNEPFETSWREERPQQLMRAYLCTGDPSCQVRFRQD